MLLTYALRKATVAGTVFLAEAFLNRDKRDALTSAEQSYLHESFRYTGGGLVLTAIAARSLFKSGVAYRIMAANPCALLCHANLFSLLMCMFHVYFYRDGSWCQSCRQHRVHDGRHVYSSRKHRPKARLLACKYHLTCPPLPPLTHLLISPHPQAFNACQAATLSPLFFFAPSILSRAALYTCGVVGSLSYVGATATNDKYLYMGGPLLAGVTVVALSSLAPLALPLGMRGLAVAESLSLYGGLAVFGGFVLYE